MHAAAQKVKQADGHSGFRGGTSRSFPRLYFAREGPLLENMVADNDAKPTGIGRAEALSSGEAGPGASPAEKGIFDHLAEYLLQKPLAASEAPSQPAIADEAPLPSDQEPAWFGTSIPAQPLPPRG